LEKEVNFEHKIIDLSNKPPAFVDKYALAVGNTETRAKVPLLEYKGRIVVESDVVSKFVAQEIGSVDAMYPKNDEEARGRVDLQGYYKFLSASNEDEVVKGRDAFCQSFQGLNDALGYGRPFLLGGTFSVAESITAPWVHRFQVAIPHFRGVELEDLDAPENISRWMKAVFDRPSVQSTLCSNDYLLESTARYFVTYITPGAPGDK
jgi:glutathione S-transferase